MEYFCKFGAIEQILLVKPNDDTHEGPATGYVYFAEASAIEKVVTSGPHTIGNAQLVIRPMRKGDPHTEESWEL
ncbi:unnamed protein product [Dibothriocephalus latus]|uniref:RRM domain-containing protein n=1 Tax=Dibothriocephalus latus TaxID=60516 RepID=A0A3P7RQJ1_DIBLA|nr:unnamed protein product [Dibothriocephalus latus]